MTTNMSREQLHQALERKERQYAKLSKRVEYLRNRAAMADRLYKELDRASRIHRLCCRAGILEKYLTDPELLTNAQVEELIQGKESTFSAFVVAAVRAAVEEVQNQQDSDR